MHFTCQTHLSFVAWEVELVLLVLQVLYSTVSQTTPLSPTDLHYFGLSIAFPPLHHWAPFM